MVEVLSSSEASSPSDPRIFFIFLLGTGIKRGSCGLQVGVSK